MEKYYDEYNIKSALRVTVADIRNVTKEGLRGDTLDLMMDAFESVAKSGADAVCIESYGGKEIVVNAATRGDILGIIFGTGVLASIDVHYLWKRITEAVRNKKILKIKPMDYMSPRQSHNTSQFFILLSNH